MYDINTDLLWFWFNIDIDFFLSFLTGQPMMHSSDVADESLGHTDSQSSALIIEDMVMDEQSPWIYLYSFLFLFPNSTSKSIGFLESFAVCPWELAGMYLGNLTWHLVTLCQTLRIKGDQHRPLPRPDLTFPSQSSNLSSTPWLGLSLFAHDTEALTP